jgi:hypothetical protein
MIMKVNVLQLTYSTVSIIIEKGEAGHRLVISNNADNGGNTTRLLEYQLAMLSHNSIPQTLPWERRSKNGLLFLHCETGSLITLKQYMKSVAWNEANALALIESLARGLLESKYYLLSEQNYLLKPECIYLDAAKLSVSMVYLPFAFEEGAQKQLAGFFEETLILLAQKAGITGLTELTTKGSRLNSSVLLTLIKKRQFAQVAFPKEEKNEAKERPFRLAETPREELLQQADKSAAGSAAAGEQYKISRYLKKMLGFIALQIVVLGLFSTFSDRLLLYEADMVSYLGAAIALVAIDILFLYKCFAVKKSDSRDEPALNEQESYQRFLERMLVRERGVLKASVLQEELSISGLDGEKKLTSPL